MQQLFALSIKLVMMYVFLIFFSLTKAHRRSACISQNKQNALPEVAVHFGSLIP